MVYWEVDSDLAKLLDEYGYEPAKVKLCPEKGQATVRKPTPGLDCTGVRLEGDGGDFMVWKDDPELALCGFQTKSSYSGAGVHLGIDESGAPTATRNVIGLHAAGGDGTCNKFLRFRTDHHKALTSASKKIPACQNVDACTCVWGQIQAPDLLHESKNRKTPRKGGKKSRQESRSTVDRQIKRKGGSKSLQKSLVRGTGTQ